MILELDIKNLICFVWVFKNSKILISILTSLDLKYFPFFLQNVGVKGLFVCEYKMKEDTKETSSASREQEIWHFFCKKGHGNCPSTVIIGSAHFPGFSFPDMLGVCYSRKMNLRMS